jgi:phosphatidylethanolamine-binding protein (PEBP) family uncharacterized protein
MQRVPIIIIAMTLAPTLTHAMSLKFSWAGYEACATASPAFDVADLPARTAQLRFRMVDQNVPSYPHGGGTVAYSGTNQIAAGAFSFTGPCPPSGEQHNYQWTVQALDSSGKVLGSAQAAAKFPP